MAAWLLVFFDAITSAARVWIINDTFNHCFLVVPAVLYALWQQRGAILRQKPAYSLLGLMAVLAAMFVYALGRAAYAELLQHIAVFGLIPAMALFLFGWRVVAVTWVPLAFTLFSVPVGEELFPQFQNITADMAVWMLELVGVPVYRDGLYITVSNGHFVVAEACSGVRFFIACIVIGCAYAYLNFLSLWRSVVFVAFSVIMPILANGVRAFGIIYIGHATDMKHAAGADHIIYGWFFFALVIVALVLVGHAFSDGQRRWQNVVNHVDDQWFRRNPKTLVLAATLPFLLVLVIAGVSGQQKNLTFNMANGLALGAVSEEQAAAELWTPRFEAADSYRVGADPVNGVRYYQAIYFANDERREMLKWSQRFFDLRKWTQKGQYSQAVEGLGTVTVIHLTAISGQQRLLAHWVVVPGGIENSIMLAKLRQAFNVLFLRPSGGAVVAVSMPFRGGLEEAEARLAQVLEKNAVTLSETSGIY